MSTVVTVSNSPEAVSTLALARRFLDAVNRRDAEALIDTMATDAFYELHVAPAPVMRGHAGIREALAALAAVWPDYQFTTKSIHADASLFVAEWTMTGTLGVALPIGKRVAIPDGRAIRFDGVDICPVVNGRISAKISYIDATSWYDGLSFQ